MKKSILGLCLTLGLAGSAMAQTHWGYQGDYAPENWGKWLTRKPAPQVKPHPR